MMREVVKFAIVLVVVMLGFTLSFYALFRGEDTYGRTCLNLFKAMLGEVDFLDEISEDRYENRYKSVATVLLVVYLVIIAIVLLNLLIAILSTSHSQVQEHADQEYRVLKARLIKHYRTVVREDLLPAPFNLVQLPLRGSKVARRYLGYLVFWLVVGPAAVIGGAILWVVSAFLIPFPQIPSMKNFHVTTWSYISTNKGFWLGVDYVGLFLRRVLGCPPRLLAWWCTRPFACVWFLFSACCRGSEQVADDSKRRRPVRVDSILAVEHEPSARALLKYLLNPLSDAKVREDERNRDTKVEHIKLLRDRLESTRVEQNKLLQSYLERKIDHKIDALQASILAAIGSEKSGPPKPIVSVEAGVPNKLVQTDF